MKIIERDLNVYEKFMAAVEETKSRGKRIAGVEFDKAEYEEFYSDAMHGLTGQACMDLMNRKEVFGIKISVVESKPAIKKKG